MRWFAKNELVICRSATEGGRNRRRRPIPEKVIPYVSKFGRVDVIGAEKRAHRRSCRAFRFRLMAQNGTHLVQGGHLSSQRATALQDTLNQHDITIKLTISVLGHCQP